MSSEQPNKLTLKRFVTPPLVMVAAMLMWAEEWLWDYVKVLTQKLSEIGLVRHYERWLASIPPYPTLAVFLVPGIALLPVKIFALWLLAHDHYLLGLFMILGAKVLGTAFAARTFVICKPKLLTIAWFSKAYGGIVKARRFLYQRVAAMPLYQKSRLVLKRLKEELTLLIRKRNNGHMLLQRWKAVRRRSKKNTPPSSS